MAHFESADLRESQWPPLAHPEERIEISPAFAAVLRLLVLNARIISEGEKDEKS